MPPRAKPAVDLASIPLPQFSPVWAGPCDRSPRGGVTQSLLGRFLVCRERFRAQVVDGWKASGGFNKRLEYGNLWHACEEGWASGFITEWFHKLNQCAQDMMERYPMQQDEVAHWYNICKKQFPKYVAYWQKHPDVTTRKPIEQEHEFHTPYELPSGRVVYLRGKRDSVDHVTDPENKDHTGKWLQENKTKGDINERVLQRQLKFDLQTGLYLTSATTDHGTLKGVRYNVIRRPLGGGRHSIRPHQATKKKPAETMTEFYDRLGGLIDGEPEYFFMRWSVRVHKNELDHFKHRTLTPVLEQLCDWWEWISSNPADPFSNPIHWQHPFGVYNSLNEGGSHDLDELIATGSTAGLVKVTNLFPELQ